jgi:SAM-dependent methyltransferase
MTRLSDRRHWDRLYQKASSVSSAASPVANRRADRPFATESPAADVGVYRRALPWLRSRLWRALGSRSAWFRPYDEFVLWDIIYRRYVPDGRGKIALEIGSAPGEYLLRLRQKLGYDPFGVEYSPEGAALNRELFRKAGIASDHVMEADLFDESFQQANRERFDLVVSRGFIEHFADSSEIARLHVNLLKPGGTVLCSVPNLRGLNYRLTHLINRDILAIHNLTIMDQNALSQAFSQADVQTAFCGYYGVLNFGVTYASERSPWRHAMRVLHGVQPLLNASFRTILAGRSGESATLSPHLLYIGRKLDRGSLAHLAAETGYQRGFS